MLVNELRTAMGKYDNDSLREIIVALYKMIPKSKKESEGLDSLLLDFTKEKKKAPKGDKQVDFDALADEIMQFMSFADASLYLAPNRQVSKDKRSKWRFEVKRFIRDLLTVKGEHSVASARILAYIYEMLCYACNYYIFRSDVPFSAVGYQQTELLHLVLAKLFYCGYDEKTIKTAVFLTLDSTTDSDTYHVSLLYTLAEFLKTPDTIEMALVQCLKYMDEYDSYQAQKHLFKYPSQQSDKYRKNEHFNWAIEMYLILKFKLHEYDEGIKFFWNKYIEYKPEIKLYIMLQFLDRDDLNEYWIREYEKAVNNKILPRDTLQIEYQRRIEDIADIMSSVEDR